MTKTPPDGFVIVAGGEKYADGFCAEGLWAGSPHAKTGKPEKGGET